MDTPKSGSSTRGDDCNSQKSSAGRCARRRWRGLLPSATSPHPPSWARNSCQRANATPTMPHVVSSTRGRRRLPYCWNHSKARSHSSAAALAKPCAIWRHPNPAQHCGQPCRTRTSACGSTPPVRSDGSAIPGTLNCYDPDLPTHHGQCDVRFERPWTSDIKTSGTTNRLKAALAATGSSGGFGASIDRCADPMAVSVRREQALGVLLRTVSVHHSIQQVMEEDFLKSSQFEKPANLLLSRESSKRLPQMPVRRRFPVQQGAEDCPSTEQVCIPDGFQRRRRVPNIERKNPPSRP